ncbi:MAG: hypothetical protein WKF59_20645 [Chitinophagaceae bacterium]
MPVEKEVTPAEGKEDKKPIEEPEQKAEDTTEKDEPKIEVAVPQNQRKNFKRRCACY